MVILYIYNMHVLYFIATHDCTVDIVVIIESNTLKWDNS